MKANEKFREEIFNIIKNQMAENNPPETNNTYYKLIEEGFDETIIMQMIGQCLAVELFDVLKNEKPFNIARYIKNLLALPKEPIE